jgi:glycosyltransferase involved in cell wall biosynthesis
MKKTLILFTSDFPFGIGEPFLEAEVNYLAKAFSEVKIISCNTTNSKTRSLPENVTVERIDFTISYTTKWLTVFSIFFPFFWREINIITKIYKKKISKGILSTMLISYFRAKKIKHRAERLLQEEKQEGTQFFFYSYWCEDTALGLALLKQKFPQLIAFTRVHRWDLDMEQSQLNYLPYRHLIAHSLNAIFSISEIGFDYCNTQWHLPDTSRLKLARLGVDQPMPFSKNEGKPFTLVSCSNAIPLKRLHLIIETLALTTVELHWVHFGDGVELKKLKKMAETLLPSTITVRWMGEVTNREVLAWYAEHLPHLFINVSQSEGIPVSIMEAMSFSTPTIATNVGGNSEIINEQNGILLSANPTPLEIKAAIDQIVTLNQEDYFTLRKAAYMTWKEKYNATANFERFTQEIHALQNGDHL